MRKGMSSFNQDSFFLKGNGRQTVQHAGAGNSLDSGNRWAYLAATATIEPATCRAIQRLHGSAEHEFITLVYRVVSKSVFR